METCHELNNVPKAIQVAIDFDKLNVQHPDAGWRTRDTKRKDELKEIFKGGQWGLCVGGSDISVLAQDDGSYITDDGLSSSEALKELFDEFRADKEAGKAEEWDNKLRAIFRL